MDQAITEWINSFAGSNAALDSIMIMATKVGLPLLVALVVAQWWSKTDRMHVRHTCIAAGLSFLIGLGLNQIIVLFVHRVRPYDAGVGRHCRGVCRSWLAPSHASFRTSGISGLLVAHFCRHPLSDRCPRRQPRGPGRGRAGMGILSGRIASRSLCHQDPVTWRYADGRRKAAVGVRKV